MSAIEKPAAKRRLSISASTEKPPTKKAHREDSLCRAETEPMQSQSVALTVEEEKSRSATPNVEDSATFLIWAEELISMVENFEVCEPELYLKPDLLSLWPHWKSLTEKERREQNLSQSCIDHWHLELAEEATERPEALQIRELWDAEFEKTSSTEDKDEKNPEYRDWWEVTMQRERPAEGVPTLEIDFSRCDHEADGTESYTGRWWLTGFAAADGDALEAMVAVRDCIGSVHY